jgi:hypothetical protein
MGDALELTVLLPALDEGGHLSEVLSEVRGAAARLTPDFEVLVEIGRASCRERV